MKELGRSKWYVLWRMTLFEIQIALDDQPRTIKTGKDPDKSEYTEISDEEFGNL
ncbi:hypothetical protein QT327_21250 [Olivibacter sp. 47]|uniref:hypothetical protein n=1 Tax=Olivibacter sp. 47 TaxID=3056486 RepID=UPI0025A3AC80|nr:hypothetical protein [Olivibacter sp. 47]MDM8176843.1 hypothetical protein [Olivibacter sp. 47]